MTELTLPQPARALWAAKRDVLHAVTALAGAPRIPPHLGGGTALAARWGHRVSVDIDVVFPGRGTLVDLLQDDAHNILEPLRGESRIIDGQRVEIAFPEGSLDLAAIEPTPALGHAEAVVDGRPEMVLSSAQILSGKLERADGLHVRDVFDIVTAAKTDPAALATAVSMRHESRTSAIAWAWSAAEARLRAAYADEDRLRVAGEYRVAPSELVSAAVNAIRSHRYRRLEVSLDGDALTIMKTIESGRLAPEVYDRQDPASAMAASGVAEHLNLNGPISGPRRVSAIEKANRQGLSQNVYDSGELGGPKGRAALT